MRTPTNALLEEPEVNIPSVHHAWIFFDYFSDILSIFLLMPTVVFWECAAEMLEDGGAARGVGSVVTSTSAFMHLLD